MPRQQPPTSARQRRMMLDRAVPRGCVKRASWSEAAKQRRTVEARLRRRVGGHHLAGSLFVRVSQSCCCAAYEGAERHRTLLERAGLARSSQRRTAHVSVADATAGGAHALPPLLDRHARQSARAARRGVAVWCGERPCSATQTRRPAEAAGHARGRARDFASRAPPRVVQGGSSSCAGAAGRVNCPQARR